MCCHTWDSADAQSSCLTQSQYTDTKPTSLNGRPLTSFQTILKQYTWYSFAWAVDIEGVDCPSATPLPFDLDFLDILQRRDMVNTFGIEEGIRVVSPSCSCDRLLMVGNFEFWILPGWRPTAYSSSIFNHQGIFNVRNLHTGPPRFYVLIREDEENSCKVPFPRDTTSGPNGVRTHDLQVASPTA